MTFSLLCLPSFWGVGSAQTPGWIHFPRSYQNRAESDRKKALGKKAPFPSPHTRGFVLPPPPEPGGRGEVDWGHPFPSTSILSPSKPGHCSLCSHTIRTRWSSLWHGWKRPPPPNRNHPFSHGCQGPKSPADSPLLWSASAWGPLERMLQEWAEISSK